MNKLKKIILFLVFIYYPHISYSIISVYPPVQRVRASVKDKIIGNIFVQNSSTITKVFVEVQPEDWSNARNAGVSWLKIKKKNFWIKPKQIKEVKYVAIVPKDAKGDLFAQIFFLPSLTHKQSGSIGIKARIASALYITVKGTEEVNAEIKEFNIIRNLNNYDFLLIPINTGNVHIKTKGTIIYRNNDTNEVNQINIKEWVYKSKESFPLHNWIENTTLKKGNYNATAILTFVDPSGNERKIQKEVEFYVDENGDILKKETYNEQQNLQKNIEDEPNIQGEVIIE